MVISKWKAEFLENVASVFEKGGRKSDDQDNPEIEKLYAQIGQLKVENDFLKKMQETGDMKARSELITPRIKKLSVRRQYQILSVSRSTLYYKPREEKPEYIKMVQDGR